MAVWAPHTENLLRDCGDFYLRRADGVFAYQLAVVVDDARMGVTEVVRGADLLSSTARQLYLYRLLGLPAPKFAHCPLLLAPDGRRLSKRDGDQSLENLRAKYTAQEIVGRLAFAYGLQPEPAPRTPESLDPRLFLGQGAQAGYLPAGRPVLKQNHNLSLETVKIVVCYLQNNTLIVEYK